jgi:hypothetical protein
MPYSYSYSYFVFIRKVTIMLTRLCFNLCSSRSNCDAFPISDYPVSVFDISSIAHEDSQVSEITSEGIKNTIGLHVEEMQSGWKRGVCSFSRIEEVKILATEDASPDNSCIQKSEASLFQKLDTKQ